MKHDPSAVVIMTLLASDLNLVMNKILERNSFHEFKGTLENLKDNQSFKSIYDSKDLKQSKKYLLLF